MTLKDEVIDYATLRILEAIRELDSTEQYICRLEDESVSNIILSLRCNLNALADCRDVGPC